MKTKINQPEPTENRYIDYESTLWVCGYTVDEANNNDNIVVRCYICDAPMLRRKINVVKYTTLPCEDCMNACASFRALMCDDEKRVDRRRKYHALKGTPGDRNVYSQRWRYAMKDVKV